MDNKNINSKTSPNQMRVFMKRIREGYNQQGFDESVNDPKKAVMTMRDMLKITRKLNEVDEREPEVNLATANDEKYLTDNFNELFQALNVTANLLSLNSDPKLKLTKDKGFWGGTIDSAIQFVYKATADKDSSGIEFKYLPSVSPDDPDNQEIVKNIETFYDTFYEYWRDNFLQV